MAPYPSGGNYMVSLKSYTKKELINLIEKEFQDAGPHKTIAVMVDSHEYGEEHGQQALIFIKEVDADGN